MEFPADSEIVACQCVGRSLPLEETLRRLLCLRRWSPWVDAVTQAVHALNSKFTYDGFLSSLPGYAHTSP
jgi:hypothetical protein